jgi:uncharacterized protein YndB with AHSA1/START domain
MAQKKHKEEGYGTTRIHKSIEIKAPVNKVFAYINNPKNEHDWLPNMIEVKNVTGSGVGTHYEWTWKIGAMRFNGESTKIEDFPEKRIVDELPRSKLRGIKSIYKE